MIFNSNKKDGPMSGQGKFYNNKSTEEIKKDLLERRKKLGEKHGFDGTKIMVPYQNLNKHEVGHTEDASEFIMDNIDADLWNYDIPCDIMLIRSNLTGVALAYPVADCPVITANDDNFIALTHCGAKEIDRYLPSMIIDGVRSITDSKPEDIKINVGPCPYPTTYIYETFPSWATNPLWERYITEEKDGFHIDMRNVIKTQLLYAGIKISNITFDTRDTINNSDFYSNYATFHGDLNKNGRHLVGIYNKFK